MKIISTKNIRKKAENFDEQYDWFDDDTNEKLRNYESKKDDNLELMEFEATEEIPFFETDEEVEGTLADSYVREDDSSNPVDNVFDDQQGVVGLQPNLPEEVEKQEPLIKKRKDVDEEDQSVADETEIDMRVPDFSSTGEAIEWAIGENRVLEVFYVTKGRGSRNEKHYLKRERGLSKSHGGGVNIHRIVEPHYIYSAADGRKIVVTYDRSVRAIRSFVIDNIYDYNFTKNRNTKKDQYFKPRNRVMPGSIKRTKNMKSINEKLTKIAFILEDKGFTKSSSIVIDAMDVVSEYKTAQYVGIQGYWLKNRRCWDNCYRNKRTASPGTPAQEVWTECWDEYKDSINNDNSSWGKYSDSSIPVKIGKSDEKEWNKEFYKKVDNRVKEGFSRAEAIYSVMEDESQVYASKIIEASSNLMTLADAFEKSGQGEIGKQISDLSIEILKEADFAGGKWDKFKDFFRSKGGAIAERLNRLIKSINQIMVNMQGGGATASSVNKKVILAQAGGPGTQPQPQPSAMPKNLNPAQTAMYGKFLSDIRQEMGYLYKMQTKTPDIMNVTQPAIQAIGAFLTNSDTLFKETGKKTFNREKVMVALSNLLNAITGASSAINQTQQADPATQNTQNPPPPPPAPTKSATQLGADLKAEAQKDPTKWKATVDVLNGKKIDQPTFDWMLDYFGNNNLPLTKSSFDEFVAALV